MCAAPTGFNHSFKDPPGGYWGDSECIILAGGLGTRLREAVPDLPKCMAPVAGRPFLFYVINYLRSEGIEKFIFSVGYKHEMILDYLKNNFSTLDYTAVIETEPLGTGGALKLACSKTSVKNILAVNGDSLFRINLNKLAGLHFSSGADCTLALKPLNNYDRYGSVVINNDFSIAGFIEKKITSSGLINGGIYLLNKEKLLSENFPDKFSFEKDYLEKCRSKQFFGSVQDEYFIDIGIPEDYQRAQEEMAQRPLKPEEIDPSWTLFLDRDGVINHEKEEDYIRSWSEFRFYEGVKDSLKFFAGRLDKIFIVSNQRGVGRGLMTEQELEEIHGQMQQEIENAGGRIDKIYYCTAADNKHPGRKPNPGMAFAAKRDFPSVDFSKSIMVGNKPGDMQFGRHAGMYTVYITSTHPEQEFPHPDIDLKFDSLLHFAEACKPAASAF